MKYYKDFAKLGIFTLKDAIGIIGNEDSAKQYLSCAIKKGYVHRIKKNLYCVVDLSSGGDTVNQYVIASNITDESFVSFHSAFEFYGFYNQTFTEVQVSSLKRFLDFSYDDYGYHYFMSKTTKQVDLVQGVKVTSIERTIVDSINMLGKVMDVEELIKCLDLIHYVKTDKLIEMLLEYDKDLLYRKVGYVLSFYKDNLSLDDSFFGFCKIHSTVNNKGSLTYGEIKNLEYIKEWGIYAYRDLKKLVDKGGNIDV